MKGRRESSRGWTLQFLRPDFASLLSVWFWVVAFLLPPQVVETSLEERDCVFLNLPMALVVLVSVAVFWMGVRLGRRRDTTRGVAELRPKLLVTRGLLLKVLWVSVTVLALELIVIFTLLRGMGLEDILLSMQDSSLATAWRTEAPGLLRVGGVNVGALMNCSYAALVGCTFIALWANRKWGRRRVCLVLLVIGGLLYGISSLMLFQRWPLFEYLVSLAVISVVYRDLRFGVKRTTLAALAAGGLVSCLGLFFLVNALRTSASGITMLLGYTVGSYNLGAAAVSGHFLQPYSHSTYVVLGWFWNAPFIGPTLRTMGRSLGLNLPSGSMLAVNTPLIWGDAVASAGLNPVYQWDTIFARFYSDVGFLFPAAFFLYGFVCQRVYERFCRLEIFGVLLYLPFLVNILSWFSGVFLATPFDDYLLFAVLIWIWLGNLWTLEVTDEVGEGGSRIFVVKGDPRRIYTAPRPT